VTGEVVHLDVVHLGALFEPFDSPHILTVTEDVLVITDPLLVSLKVDDIDLIKADECREEANVGEGEGFAGEELATIGKKGLKFVKRAKEVPDCTVVGFLGGSESALVDTVVDALVSPVIDSLLGRDETSGVQVELCVLGKFVESGVEHEDDFGALVVDDRLGLLVPQNGDRVLATRVIGELVKISHKLGSVDRVFL